MHEKKDEEAEAFADWKRQAARAGRATRAIRDLERELAALRREQDGAQHNETLAWNKLISLRQGLLAGTGPVDTA